MKLIYLLVLFIIPEFGYSCTCFYATLPQIIEQNKNLDNENKPLFIKAKILGRNTSVYGYPYSVNPVTIQIHEYWNNEEIEFKSDTLTVFDSVLCGSNFKKDSIYLIVAHLDTNGDIYRTWCGKHLIYSSKKTVPNRVDGPARFN